jgi:CheY-specific phosphatase CheX
MRNADATVLRQHVVQGTRETFGAYAIDVDLDEGDPCELAHDHQVVTFIGFGGSQLRGTLTVMAPEALWLRTYPIPYAPGAEPCQSDVLDWCGELVNQVLGRIKNHLMRHGVELQVSTPKAMHASQLTISRSAQQSVCMLRARLGTGVMVGVWFDAAVEHPGRLFSPQNEVEPASASEGELLLF